MPKKNTEPEPVIWETPPERPYRYPWEQIAEQLRARPMEWAKIFEQDRTSVVVAIRQGSITWVHPDLGFDVRTARNTRQGTRRCDLYLRYNPERAELPAAIREGRRRIR
jgi:hypothetical protein